MLKLSDQEKQEVVRYLEADKSLPEQYRFLLFEDKRDLIRIQKSPAGQAAFQGMESPQMEFAEYEEIWTGDFIFETEWQSFRTKKDRSLDLKSVAHECSPGRHKIAVKVTHLFGNDTMTIVEVTV